MKSRWVGVALVLALVITGCETSNLSANENVTVSGKFLAPDGSPAANVNVVLVKQLDAGEALGGSLLAGMTLGVACLSTSPPDVCRGDHQTTTGADGGFSFALKGSDTQGSVAQASTFALTAVASPNDNELSGPAATMTFKVQTSVLILPSVKLWHPQLSTQQGKVTWSPFTGTYSGVQDDRNHWCGHSHMGGR